MTEWKVDWLYAYLNMHFNNSWLEAMSVYVYILAINKSGLNHLHFIQFVHFVPVINIVQISRFIQSLCGVQIEKCIFFPGTEPHSLQLSRVGVRLFIIKDLKTKSRTNFEQPFRSVCDKNFYTTVYSDSIVFWKRLCQNRMK